MVKSACSRTTISTHALGVCTGATLPLLHIVILHVNNIDPYRHSARGGFKTWQTWPEVEYAMFMMQCTEINL
jgi:hypothetical protein